MIIQRRRHSLFKRIFGSLFLAIGVIFGAASVVSLTQKGFNIEIAFGIAKEALSLYKEMLHYIKILLFDWWTPVYIGNIQFYMPYWGMDILAIWMSAGLFRLAPAEVLFCYRKIPLKSRIWTIINYTIFAPYRYVIVVYYRARTFFIYLFLSKNTMKRYVFESDYKIYSREHIRDIINPARDVALLLSPFLIAAIFFLWNSIQL